MWEALLEKSEITGHLERIENSVMESYFKSKETGLLNGKMGYALYFSYLKEIKKNDLYDHHIEYAVGESIQFDKNQYSTFCTGISGIFWGINYLQNKKIIETDLSFDDYNTHIAQLILQTIAGKNYDYLHGPVGNMLYLMDVAPAIAKSIETEFINKLYATAEETETTIRWEMYISKSLDSGMMGYNLSLSHGVSSVILLLCMLYKTAENDTALLHKLIQKSANYILSEENKDNKISLFPGYVLADQSHMRHSRLAWCYGDLGIGYAIYRAGQTINDASLTENGIRILLKTTERKAYELTELNDAGFCHGTAGVAHFYNRIYQETKNELFKEAALFWFRETLKFEQPGKNECAGYSFYNAVKKEYEDNYTLLEGLCGVGIALLAASSDIEPAWDRSLFLS